MSAVRLRLTPDADLRMRNSFGVAARCRMLAEAATLDAIIESLELARREQLPVVTIGGGSNLLFVSDLDALLLSPQLLGIEWLGVERGRRHVRVGAGENWHAFVASSIRAGGFGLENLALIPGTVGAAPMQNIGAYGVELERFVVAVEVYDRERGEVVRFGRLECGFGYRDSVFKRTGGDRYLVLAVEFALLTEPDLHLGYAGLGDELARAGLGDPSAQDVFDAVCAIRRRKLPDPGKIGNAGSFFKNPIVSVEHADELRGRHAALPAFPAGTAHRKLAAAWLIEQCGWKGYRRGDAGVHSEHALVLVNHGDASGREILDLANAIQTNVTARFGVKLEPEPRVLGQ